MAQIITLEEGRKLVEKYQIVIHEEKRKKRIERDNRYEHNFKIIQKMKGNLVYDG